MKKDTKIIEFPNSTNKSFTKKKKDWILFFTAFGTLIALLALLSQIGRDKKTEIQFKPTFSLKGRYYEDEYYGDVKLTKDNIYIDKVFVMLDDNSADNVSIVVEPFFNIIYYNQEQETLLKQILPIQNYERVSPLYSPLSIDYSKKPDNIFAEINFNEKTYDVISSMENFCVDGDYINYSDYLFNIFTNSIIASIDFEFYIIINYADIYQNIYTDVYLCETGFKNYSSYLPNCLSYCEQNWDNMEDSVKAFNTYHSVKYTALKDKNIKNLEFNGTITKVPNDDFLFGEFHDFYNKKTDASDTFMFAVNDFGINDIYFNNDLQLLITFGYIKKQLVFILDEENGNWNICDFEDQAPIIIQTMNY